MLQGKKILLGVSGSIAAYKAAALTRLLVKNGAIVKVVMTKAATHFITPLTLSTLSNNKVLTHLFEEDTWSNHVMLGRWADVMVIAPASCNTIAKMAHGICDNILQAIYLSATCKVMIAPAMDEDMWHHSSTKQNIEKLASFGNTIIPVANGFLASGLMGEGRMAEPEYIVDYLNQYFQDSNDLQGKTVLITAGPTQEAIDPVRYISNHSTGKMGIALATACYQRGATVTLVLGPTNEVVPPNTNIVRVVTAQQMMDACIHVFDKTDIAIMCAAVADYTPVHVATEKIKKSDQNLNIAFTKTPDILKHLGTIKKDHQILVGFALETNNENEYALLKLQQKNADFIVLNSMKDKDAGFGKDTNKITIFSKGGTVTSFETKTKEAVAHDIIHTILNH
ncbi:bifunctional phosphopantothenoylcysteine decarboxylase/phosphopantothenate--cysteine ligase CoaBC [Ferruginibacter yonginensis]|uniref:Coenzyme A biosynthesis bifunctional protein CoaBC n=1 Tax=Ferruginibacter yonginensis TaxID=1310416 RepID=A0ABV8QPF8_9BACT